MKKNLPLFVLALLIILLVVLAVFFYQKNENVSGSFESQKTAEDKDSKQKEIYFDENAKVMYFYSEYCGWCKRQAEVLKELAKEGYRVKPMNVKLHPEYWQEYQIEGTPAFVSENGEKRIGFQTKEKLKKFLDKYR